MAFLRPSLLLLILHCSVSIAARADGVRFFHGSWSQVMAEARRQNKPIFVDVYTTWCGPCKLMAAQAFPNARVGEKMNANFISYKIDAEKGEGSIIAKRYGVQAFPTSLFIGSDGRLIRRTLGYSGIDTFLAEAQRALSDANAINAMAIWNNKFDAGERSPEFLRGMLRKQAEYYRPTGDVLDEYVKTLPKADTLATKEVEFLSQMLTTTYTTAYLLLAKQVNRLAKSSTPLSGDLTKAFARAERYDFNDAVAVQDELMLENLIKQKAAKQRASTLATLAAPEQKAVLEREADDTRLQFYKASRLQAHYIALVKKIAENRLMTKTDAELALADSVTVNAKTPIISPVSAYLPDSTQQSDSTGIIAVIQPPKRPVSSLTARQLCDLAKGLTESSTDKKDLAQALRWSARAVQIDGCPSNAITHARLLTRAGRKADAKQQLDKALTKESTTEPDKTRLRQEIARLK